MSTRQPRLPILEKDITFLELSTPVSQTFHLPALQHEASFKLVLNKVIVPSFRIQCDRIACGGGFGLFSHGGIIFKTASLD